VLKEKNQEILKKNKEIVDHTQKQLLKWCLLVHANILRFSEDEALKNEFSSLEAQEEKFFE